MFPSTVIAQKIWNFESVGLRLRANGGFAPRQKPETRLGASVTAFFDGNAANRPELPGIHTGAGSSGHFLFSKPLRRQGTEILHAVQRLAVLLVSCKGNSCTLDWPILDEALLRPDAKRG